MLPDCSIIDGKYLQDILSQPDALQATWQALESSPAVDKLAARLGKGKFRRVILTGMGSSLHALHPMNLKLVGHGFTAFMVETSELVHYNSRFFDPQTLVIAVSQSGRSAEVVRLLETNRGRAALIAVTNTPDSPLGRRADALVLTHAGEEFSVSCKTYVTALMALERVGGILCKVDSRRIQKALSLAAPAVAHYLSEWRDHVQFLCSELDNVEHLFLVGRGPSLAAVGTGALITKESAQFHAEGMSSAAFRHGPMEMLGRETFVLVFSGDRKTRDLNRKLLHDIQARGGKARLVSEDTVTPAFRAAEVPSSVCPIVEILPVQMITLALAARAGREPGCFKLASKVTATE